MHGWLSIGILILKKKLGKVPEDILWIKKGQCGIHTFRILKYLLTHKYSIYAPLNKS